MTLCKSFNPNAPVHPAVSGFLKHAKDYFGERLNEYGERRRMSSAFHMRVLGTRGKDHPWERPSGLGP